jgi:hypothetical protein
VCVSCVSRAPAGGREQVDGETLTALGGALASVRAALGRLTPLAFSYENPFCIGLLYGRTGRLTAENGGFRLGQLPLDPRIGKLILLGTVFRCLAPALILAASLEGRSPFVATAAKRDAAAAVKRGMDPWSDHMALLAAFRGWQDCGGAAAQRKFAEEHLLSHPALLEMARSCEMFKRHLSALGLYSATDAERYDEHADNLPMARALLAAALYPNVASVSATANKQQAGPMAESSGAPAVKLEYHIVDLFSKKATVKANGEVNDRVVRLHPSSVLGAQARLGALVQQEHAKRSALFVVYFGLMKTSQIFMCDASVVSPLPLVLMAGSLQLEDTDENEQDEQEAAQEEGGRVTMSIDGWLRFVASAPHAKLLLSLRQHIAELLRAELQRAVTGGSAAPHDASASSIVAAVATLLRDSDCGAGATSARPLPRGWEMVEDPSSSIGRVYYRNMLSGATQRERPTAAAAAAKKEGPTPGVRLLPPAPVAPVVRELSEKEKADAEAAAAARAEASAKTAARAAEEVAAESERVRLATLRLVQEGEDAQARGRQSGGVRVVSVAVLLKSLELEKYAESFAEAGVGDYRLEEIIFTVNEDASEGAEAVDQLIADTGARGGAAVQLRRALTAPSKGESSQVGGRGGGAKGKGGEGGGRGGKKLSKKEAATAAAKEKKEEAAAAKKQEKLRAAQAEVLRAAGRSLATPTGGDADVALQALEATLMPLVKQGDAKVAAGDAAAGLKLYQVGPQGLGLSAPPCQRTTAVAPSLSRALHVRRRWTASAAPVSSAQSSRNGSTPPRRKRRCEERQLPSGMAPCCQHCDVYRDIRLRGTRGMRRDATRGTSRGAGYVLNCGRK